jgi:nicotinamide riboside transporter PnuC
MKTKKRLAMSVYTVLTMFATIVSMKAMCDVIRGVDSVALAFELISVILLSALASCWAGVVLSDE